MAAVPLVRVKVLLQVQAASKQIRADWQYKGMVDCLVRIPREMGFFSFWRGNLASVIWYSPTQALNFAFKDTYKQIFMSKVDEEKQGLLPNTQQTSFILSFFVAQVVTTFSGMLSHLFDTVRRRIMMQRRETEWQDKGTVDCFMKIHEPGGLNAFCCGAFSNILCGTGGALVLVL